MKMKKRRGLLSFALALAFVFSLFPNVNAKAADPEIIESVTINVTAPTAGETAEYGDNGWSPVVASVSTSGCSASWYQFNKCLPSESEDYELSETSFVFEEGGYYYFELFIDADEGYEFKGDKVTNEWGAVESFNLTAEVNVVGISESDWELSSYCFVNSIAIYGRVKAAADTEEPVEYEILDGADQAVTVGAGEDLVVRASGSPDNLDKLLIDDTEVPEASRTITEGSTIATIKAAFLDTLKEGEHTLTFVYTDGEVSTVFTVVKAAVTTEAAPAASVDATTEAAAKTDKSPKTADPLPVAMVTMLMFVSLAGIVVLKKQDK